MKIWQSIEISEIEGTGKEYERVLRAVKGMDCSANDLPAVIASFIMFQDERKFGIQSGLFISALIEDGPDCAYTIHTHLFDKKMHFLGCRNRKRVTIIGDAGWGTGYEMKDGIIMVIGNVGETVGWNMRSGILTVNGDAGKSAGHCMNGGRLIIKGNAGRFAGDRMCGGSLTVEQDAGDSAGATMQGGKLEIYGNAGSEIGGWEDNPRFGTDYYLLAMKGGELHIHGKCNSLNPYIHGGKVFVGGVQVFPYQRLD